MYQRMIDVPDEDKEGLEELTSGDKHGFLGHKTI